jgi:hypothetical protein
MDIQPKKRKNLKVVKDTHGTCTDLLNPGSEISLPWNLIDTVRKKGIVSGERFHLFIRTRPGRYRRVKVMYFCDSSHMECCGPLEYLTR